MRSQAEWIVFGVSFGLFNLALGLWLGSVIMRRLNNKVIYWKDMHIAAQVQHLEARRRQAEAQDQHIEALREQVAYLEKEISDDSSRS